MSQAIGIDSREDLAEHYFWIGLGGNAIFFGLQAMLVPRLTRKKYRSFRVNIIGEDGQQKQKLSLVEVGLVAIWILGPQLALFILGSLFAQIYSASTGVNHISSWSLWLRFLVVGPYAIGLALRAKYPRFHFQAHGYRYI
jgi:hypothetical protein